MDYVDAYNDAGWRRAEELEIEVRELAADAARGWQRAEELDVRVRELEARVGSSLDTSAEYTHDGLAIWHRAVPFLKDQRFRAAYTDGMTSGHHMGRPKGSDEDIHIEWRVHVICWAAAHAAQLDGDFVECGVNTGLYSLAICRYVDFNRLDRDFWLFDTYRGIPLDQAADAERDLAVAHNESHYEECYDLARANFAKYPRARLVRGVVPEALGSVEIDRVAFLSVDFGIAAPEIAALEHFWPRMVAGGIVLLDDYGWLRRATQRAAMDAFARRVGVEILVLPTGQGLLIKP